MKTPQDITMGIMKGTERAVNFGQMIKDQEAFLSKARRMAGSKPSKTEQAYIAEQEHKLTQLEDIVKDWVREAFYDMDDIVDKTMYWSTVERNFNITVTVSKK